MINIKEKIARYYVAVRPQTNEFHNVHKEDCPFMPDESKRIFLGMFCSGDDALKEGKKYFSVSNKCQFCSSDEHKHQETVFSGIDNACYFPTENQMSLSESGALYYYLN